MAKKIVLLLIVILGITSCVPRKELQYYRGVENLSKQEATNYEPILKQDDLLMIVVLAPTPELAADFNLAAFGVIGDGGAFLGRPDSVNSQMRYQSYLIDNKGFIEFPVLGSIQLGGLTRTEALDLLKTKLKAYINEPIVSLRILNFKVTVQGEVARPGTFTTSTERITLPEALSMAGDLTIYGKRDNVLIIREIDGKKESHSIDMTKSDFINSPYYYLSQNDVVYVEPNKTKMNSAAVGPNISIILSSVSLLITIIALLIR
ncbi:polysaccharide biosynthesis/export family protein [Flavobacterium sp. SM2513]|uniref:polysaccharide biosynthesis/export family protein n=1 Tax=Flavobacterium sp. SM2513 TaxID=3424766 RepID=UPI003D7F34C6